MSDNENKFLTGIDKPSKSWKEVARSLYGMELEGKKQQKELVDSLKSKLKEAEAKPQEIDFRALGALSDALTGSKIHQTMTDPNAEGRRRVSELQGRLQKAVSDMSDKELSELRTKLNTSFQMANLEATEENRQKMHDLEMKDLQRQKDRDAMMAKAGKTALHYEDREFAKNVDEKEQDYAMTRVKLDQLVDLKQELLKHPEYSGSMTSNELWNFAFNREGLMLKENFDKFVQEDMKKILGGAFAQKEGEGVLRRSFNLAASHEDNVARINTFIEMIKKGNDLNKAKIDYYYRNNRSLEGWRDSPELKEYKKEVAAYHKSLKEELKAHDKKRRVGSLEDRRKAMKERYLRENPDFNTAVPPGELK